MATYLEYLGRAIQKAVFEQIENGQIFATIPQFDGLWAVGKDREEARRELHDALDAWLDAHLKVNGERPPVIDGLDLLERPRVTE